MILEAVQAANAGLESPEPVAPPRILLTGSYVEGVIHLAAEIADALPTPTAAAYATGT